MSDQMAILAMKTYNEGIQKCKTKEEISKFCQLICTLSAKTIHGIEGKRFKKDFLTEAAKDNEKIVPVMAH